MTPAMIPASILEERRRLGHDRFDEVWEGVLHLVPFPSLRHQRIVMRLAVMLHAAAARRGLEVFSQTGLYDPAVRDDSEYRGPDVMLASLHHASKRGIEGHAQLVIEVISPNDESRDKLPFYARIGVGEVWLIDPRGPSIEMFAGIHPIEKSQLGLELHFEGAILHIRDGADTYTVDTADNP